MKKLLVLIGTVLTASLSQGVQLYSESFTDMTDWVNSGTVSDIDNSAEGLTGFGVAASGPAVTATSRPDTPADTRFATGHNEVAIDLGGLSGNGDGTVYVSFLIHTSSCESWGEDFIVGLTPGNSTSGFGVGLGWNAGALTFGIAAGNSAESSLLQHGAMVSMGATYLVVAKFDWLDAGPWVSIPNGLTTSMSIYDVDAPTEEPVVWDLSMSGDKVWPFNDSTVLLDTVFIRKGNSGMQTIVDEIRIGTTFEDVIPTPESGTIGTFGRVEEPRPVLDLEQTVASL